MGEPHSVLSSPYSVLFLAGEYPPRPGGVGDYTALLARHLAAQGLRVTVLATRANGLRPGVLPSAPRAAVGERGELVASDPQGVRVWRAVDRWDWRSGQRVVAAVRASRADIVHLQYQPAAFGLEPAVCWLAGWLRHRCPGVRTVTTFHDLRVPYLFPKAGPLRAAVRDRLLRGSDAVVLTEPADWAAATAVRPIGCYWIPIGSNLAVAPPAGYDRRRWRAQVGATDATFLIAHLGFFNRSKGLETLLEAVACLRRQGSPVRLLLVGAEVGASDPANRAYAADLEQRLAAADLRDAVERTPLVPAAVASAYLLAADAAAFPFVDGASLRRGSLLAALAHGLPTVSTVADRRMVRGPTDSLDARPPFVLPPVSLQDALLLVPPGDAVALSAALAELADDAALRDRLANAGRRLIDALAWPRIADAHIIMYSRTLGHS